MMKTVKLAEKIVAELFKLQFFQNAFFISLLLSLLFGILSFFVVMRKMAFLGAGIAHTAFGGVALGILLGINPFYTSLIFCLVISVLIGKLVKFGNISVDTSIAIFFSFSMAAGALFIAQKKAYTFDLSGYLFGNILGVDTSDLLITLSVSILFMLYVIFLFHKLLYLTFDEEAARISGINTELLDISLLLFLALIIVIGIKIVGMILVSALVVLPASFGMLISKNYRIVIAVSAAYSITIMVGGLFVSYVFNFPAGATIVVLGTLIYFICITVKRWQHT